MCDQTKVDEPWVRVRGIIRTDVTWCANSVHHGLKFIQNQPETEEINEMLYICTWYIIEITMLTVCCKAKKKLRLQIADNS